MLVTVIMTTHNTARWVRDAITSVLRSTHTDLQLCIIDDGSTDRTPEFIERAARTDNRITHTLEPHHGRLHALRTAHDLADGELVCWVDSDDLIHPDAIATSINAIDNNHQLAWTHRRLINHKSRDLGPDPNNTTPYEPLQLLVSNMIFHLRTYTRDLYNQSGGTGTLTSAIDWDMNLRMTEHTTPRCIPHELYHYRIRPGRMTGTPTQQRNAKTAVRNAINRRDLDVELVVNTTGWHLRRTT